MAIIKITWVAAMDAKTCKVCHYLHGHTWIIVADELPRIISHPHYGDVYDLTMDESLAHGYGPWHCRCKLLIEIEDDMKETFNKITEDILDLSYNLGMTLQTTIRFLNFLRGMA